MNAMDEISYWIYTKRAPCLMNYDKAKNLSEEGQCPKPKPKSVPNDIKVSSPKKKKKRKLSLLDDESLSDKQQNVYFNTSQNQKRTLIPSCKSDTLGSEIDFNIRNTSVQEKPKKSTLNKSRTTLHRKNKVMTSTPKVGTLRRSLRRTQHALDSQLNRSFEIFNNTCVNGTNFKDSIEEKTTENLKTELLAGGDQTTNSKKEVSHNLRPRNEVINGQFEDLSDVSGFTANYIRSTKIHTKTPRKLKCKNNRNLVKESQSAQQETPMVVCMNKSVNTTKPTALNLSRDSENIINCIEGNSKSPKMSKSTSILKFMDSKTNKKSNNKLDSRKSNNNHNESFQSSTISRYPKRCRNSVTRDTTTMLVQQVQKRRKNCINHVTDISSERKENPDQSITRTRSGRNIALVLRPPENTVLVLSKTEQVSSVVSMNVADPGSNQKASGKKQKPITRHLRSRKSDKHATQDSMRDKSGFAMCFSDSDNDSEPLKPRKYFCT